MKCSICKKKIKYKEPPECFINFHRSWRGKEWKPDKAFLYFKFSHMDVNETQGYDSNNSLYFCSCECLERWCKDIVDNGYWRD